MSEGQAPPTTALVVEGGGLRTIFAAGLLDGFLNAGFDPFDLHVGVSAGSGALAGFLARMPGRTHRVMADYSLRPEFVSWRRFLKGGHMVDLDWLWAITVAEIPLDLPVLFGEVHRAFVVVLTDAVTGQAVYVRATPDNILDVLKASNALPFLYRGFPAVDGHPMSDGGAADALPVAWTLKQGVRRVLVVRSRPYGYRRRTSRTEDLAVRTTLRRYPALVRALATRAPRYNATLEHIRRPPPGVEIVEVCPPDDFRVERLGQHAATLQQGYDAGRAMAPGVIARWQTPSPTVSQEPLA